MAKTHDPTKTYVSEIKEELSCIEKELGDEFDSRCADIILMLGQALDDIEGAILSIGKRLDTLEMA